MGKKGKKKKTIVKEQKSVILTVKDDGKLAVAAHQDGSIAYVIDQVEEVITVDKAEEAARKKAEKEARKKAKKEAREKARMAKRNKYKKPIPAPKSADEEPAAEAEVKAEAIEEPVVNAEQAAVSEEAAVASVAETTEPVSEDTAEPVTGEAAEPAAEEPEETNTEETAEPTAEETTEPVAEEPEEPIAEEFAEPVAEESPEENPEAASEDVNPEKDISVEDAEAMVLAVNEGSIVPVDSKETKALKPFLKGLIAAAIVFVIAGAGWITYDFLIPKQVTVIVQTLEQTQEIKGEVKAQNIREALTMLDVPISDIDSVQPGLNQHLGSGTTINVTKRLESSATIAGEEQKFILIPGTVEENLEFNDIEYDSDDIVIPALYSEMDSTSKIEVKDVVKVVSEKEKKIPYKSTVILDPSISSGTKTETFGKNGKAIYTYTTTYINGEKEGTEKEFKEWIEEPVDNTVRLGTSATGESGEVTIRQSFISNTTAYYCGTKARGATGKLCHYGTVAVDPKVFPYGSRFWIAGYGYAVATDCGGAIKGTKIDLYMRSLKECYRWGRRYVQAYLIG